MHLRYVVTMTGILGLMAGCAVYQVDRGMPDSRALGREYATYKPPVISKESHQTPELSLPEVQEGAISLHEALALALMRNPELAAFSWETRAAEARRLQSGLIPNPEVSTEIEEFSGDRPGWDASEVTVSLSQLFLLGGERRKGVRVADFEVELSEWAYEARRLDLVTEVANAFIDLLGAQQHAEFTEESRDIAENVAIAVSERVKAGAASPVEELRAKVMLSSATIKVKRAEQVLFSVRRRLAGTWGSSEPRFTSAGGELMPDFDLPPLAEIAHLLTGNPDIARWDSEMDLRRASLDLEKAKAIPNVGVEVGYRRIVQEEADTLVAGLSLPLPLFDRGQGSIAEERARLAAAGMERRAAENRINTALADAYTILDTASSEVKMLWQEALPAAGSAFEIVQEGYRQGKFNYLDLLGAQQTWSETRMNYISALVSLNRARVRVERLIAAPLVPVHPDLVEPKEIYQ